MKKSSIAGNTYSNLFEGDGEMAALMRAYDWDAHPMGNPDSWPESLKTTIRLMLHSDFPMFVWWSKDFYMFHNDAYLPALGKKHPKALGASARVMWAEIWDQLGGVAENIIQGGEPFYAQELMILLERKGFLEETYWTFSYSPAPSDEGGIGGMFCACTEVTKSVLGHRRMRIIKEISDATIDVKTVEEAGHLAANILSTNLNDIPFSLIYLLDATGAEARLLGKSGDIQPDLAPVEVDLNKPGASAFWCLPEVLHNNRAKIFELPGRAEGQAKAAKSEAPLVKQAVVLPMLKPGEDKPIGFFVAALSPRLEYDADYRNFYSLLVGQIAASLASVQAREEARRQQEELINLFEQAPVAIAIMRGGKFVVELANPNMCEFWGRSHEEVINQPVFDALPEARGQGLEDLLMDVYQNGVYHAFNEFKIVLERNGKEETIYANFIYYPFRNSKGVIIGVLAIAVEVTKQVEAREEVEQKNKELLAINADLDNFVYSASHDLKGPILNIEGLMKVLMPKLPAESLQIKDVEQVIKLIFSSIDRLKDTIADLSEVSRVQKEAREDVRLIDMAELVEDVISDIQLDIQKAGAIIETDLKGCSIRFSPKNFRSIVYNLLSNAVKYRSPERTPRIRLQSQEKDNYLIFSVEDNGLGMDLKYESKIFSMFKRLHSHVEGSGVGLYIVKRIVENAGGKIEVESKINEGSTFRVYFRK